MFTVRPYIQAIRLLTLTHRVDLFDQLSHSAWYHSALNSFIHTLSLQHTDHHLDIGCGTGWFTLWTAPYTHTSVGLDDNPLMLKRAHHNKLQQETSSNVSYVEGSALRLPFDRHSFDVVTGNMLLPVLPDPVAALSEMFRVLKPNGKAGLFLPTEKLNRVNALPYIKQQQWSGFDASSFLAWSLTGSGFSMDKLNSLLNATTCAYHITHSSYLFNEMALMVVIEKREEHGMTDASGFD
ncbi:class I SAM-dependent methyltransferase [Marinicrinis sediminis]|uniref:Class I SAM-dependent methyltransferase n=1 Tax=Marinicrinis sediminis TaxID=1652465 RepID=A0ABW5R9Q5_9BACL